MHGMGQASGRFSPIPDARAPSPPPATPSVQYRPLPAGDGGREAAQLGPVPDPGRAAQVRRCAQGRSEDGRAPRPAADRYRRRQAVRHDHAAQLRRQRRAQARRPVHGYGQPARGHGNRQLHRRRPRALPGFVDPHGRRPRRRQSGHRHPQDHQHPLPADRAPRQRQGRLGRPAGRAGADAPLHLHHLRSVAAGMGAACAGDRRRQRRGLRHRAQRGPEDLQRADPVRALVQVPDRRSTQQRLPVPGHRPVRAQRLRLHAAVLPEPGAELRRHFVSALHELARLHAGQRIPLSVRRRQGRDPVNVHAERPVARQGPRQVRIPGLPQPGFALAGARFGGLGQRRALYGGLLQTPARQLGVQPAEHGRRLRHRRDLDRRPDGRPLAADRLHPDRGCAAVQPPAARLLQLGPVLRQLLRGRPV